MAARWGGGFSGFGDFDAVVLTCEHARNSVPKSLAAKFQGKSDWLSTHAGWDIGALEVAKRVVSGLRCKLFEGEVSRLVVDLNRSAHRAGVFSKVTRELSAAVRKDLLARYWHPYREAVTKEMDRSTERGRSVLHLSIHSFTPVLGRTKRRADVGILYDPQRKEEARAARELARVLAKQNPEWRVRRNYPYVGYSDGFTTTLRKRYPSRQYAGIEVEWNQALIEDAAGQKRAAEALLEALATW
jgi:predicted N-formylglutamate amidohydrolase